MCKKNKDNEFLKNKKEVDEILEDLGENEIEYKGNVFDKIKKRLEDENGNKKN